MIQLMMQEGDMRGCVLPVADREEKRSISSDIIRKEELIERIQIIR
jgi:hypothetical protein